MKKLIVIALLILAIGGLGASFLHKKPAAQPETINERITHAIVRDIPAFSLNGEPVFKLDSISHPEEKWYVVSVSSLHHTKVHVPVKIALIDNGMPDDGLRVIAGPDTYFPESQSSALNLPDSVILELQKS